MNETAGLNPERWIDEHANVLYRYALTRVRDHSLAEDMVQETFHAAIKSAARFKPGLSERAWLMGIPCL